MPLLKTLRHLSSHLSSGLNPFRKDLPDNPWDGKENSYEHYVIDPDPAHANTGGMAWEDSRTIPKTSYHNYAGVYESFAATIRAGHQGVGYDERSHIPIKHCFLSMGDTRTQVAGDVSFQNLTMLNWGTPKDVIRPGANFNILNTMSGWSMSGTFCASNGAINGGEWRFTDLAPAMAGAGPAVNTRVSGGHPTFHRTVDPYHPDQNRSLQCYWGGPRSSSTGSQGIEWHHKLEGPAIWGIDGASLRNPPGGRTMFAAVGRGVGIAWNAPSHTISSGWKNEQSSPPTIEEMGGISTRYNPYYGSWTISNLKGQECIFFGFDANQEPFLVIGTYGKRKRLELNDDGSVTCRPWNIS